MEEIRAAGELKEEEKGKAGKKTKKERTKANNKIGHLQSEQKYESKPSRIRDCQLWKIRIKMRRRDVLGFRRQQ